MAMIITVLYGARAGHKRACMAGVHCVRQFTRVYLLPANLLELDVLLALSPRRLAAALGAEDLRVFGAELRL